MTASPRSLSSHFYFFRASFLVLAVLVAASLSSGRMQAETTAPPPTTVVVFGDHHIENGLWMALVDELHKSQVEEATTVPLLAGEFDVIRGDKAVPVVDSKVLLSVTIIGDCSLLPRPRRYVEGALGWVRQVKGEIRPFIHVDCGRIGEMLGPIALGMNQKRRDTVMAEAMARVIVHEWIHVATQKVGHSRNGVMQSQFELWDLLAGDTRINPRQDGRRVRTGEASNQSKDCSNGGLAGDH